MKLKTLFVMTAITTAVLAGCTTSDNSAPKTTNENSIPTAEVIAN